MGQAIPFDPYAKDCPSRGLVDRIGDRWTILVIGALATGPLRYGGIAEQVSGISPRMLSQTLKGLERDGLITREAHAETPPRVEYALTERGATLRPVLLAVEDWARAHMAEVLASRERFDSAARTPGTTPSNPSIPGAPR